MDGAIGQPIRRKEDQRLLVGEGEFSDDHSLPHQCWAVMVRCPFAHAVIKNIDTNIQLQVPYFKGNEISRSEFSTELKYAELGFLMPKNPILPDLIPDVIIVPGRFFDRTGNRIGRGGGHYDKFLSQYMDSVFVGIALDEALTRVIPYETHDIKMDIIIYQSFHQLPIQKDFTMSQELTDH